MISGSVLPAGDRVRVTVQLIDARVSEAILWGDSFERDSADVLGFHAEVAQVRHRCASPF